MALNSATQVELASTSAQIVMDRIARQAIENERLLTEEELQRLALARGPDADPFFEARIIVFLHRIVDRDESKSGGLDCGLKLKDVLRYAGADTSYAVALARYVVSRPKPPFRLRKWLTDKTALPLWVLVGFGTVFAVFLMLCAMGIR